LLAASTLANSMKQLPLKSLLPRWRRWRTQFTGPAPPKNAVRSSSVAVYGKGAAYRLRASIARASSSGGSSGTARRTRRPSALTTSAPEPRSTSATCVRPE